MRTYINLNLKKKSKRCFEKNSKASVFSRNNIASVCGTYYDKKWKAENFSRGYLGNGAKQ